ncbi:MAG: hypothetical protein LBE91_04770, partial [Tannerella sp.]|nr:hypothetical protein [Tannerella sp.]
MEKVTRESLFEIKFLSDVKLSPDGRHAAFVVTNGCVNENKYRSYIWVYGFQTKKLLKLTAAGDEKNIEWLDNENLIFPASRDE